MRRSAILVLFLAPVSALGCSAFEGKSCTLVGCSSQATGTFDVPFAAADLDGRRLEICRGSQCVSAAMHVENGALHCIAHAREISGGPRANCEPSLEPLPSGVRIHPVYLQGPKERLTDGDVFKFRITDASGEGTLAQGGGTVPKYRVWYPNGKECDEEDGFQCADARF